MPDRRDLERRLAGWFLDKLHVEIPSPDTDLLETGVLDSLGFIELLLHLEQDFGVTVDLEQLELHNFRSNRAHYRLRGRRGWPFRRERRAGGVMTGTSAGRVRPFHEGDLLQVADLHHRVFGGGTGSAPPALSAYLEDIFCRNPWRDDGLPSLVYEDNRGRVAGCLGVMPRPMWMNGCRVRAAVSHNFMVDPASRSTLAAVRLVKAYVTGPQDIALADANHLSRQMWGLAGGTTPLLYRMRWTRALQPARYALSWLRTRGVARFAVEGLRPVCWPVDAVVTRLAASPFRHAQPSLAGEELDGRALAECLSDFSGNRSLRPEYDRRSAAWLLAMLGRKTHLGTLQKTLVRDATGRVAGWYLYYLKRGDIAEVVQLGGREDSISAVLDHLFHDAWQGGAIAISGQVDPAYMQPLSDAHCVFRLDRRTGGVRLHSRRQDVLQTILRGDAFLTRLESEWWIPFE